MTYRAKANCPVCNSEEEVWIQNGKVCFTEIIHCDRCGSIYDPLEFLSQLMDLRSNNTVSSKHESSSISTLS